MAASPAKTKREVPSQLVAVYDAWAARQQAEAALAQSKAELFARRAEAIRTGIVEATVMEGAVVSW